MVAEFVRWIQISTENRRSVVALIAILLALSIGGKSVTAFQEAREFSLVSRTLDNWFIVIENNTEPEDPIIVAFVNGVPDSYSLQVAFRVYYILSRCYDRDNVYFAPVPDTPTLEELQPKLLRADTRRHAKKMKSIEQMDSSQPPAAIMIINGGVMRSANQPISYDIDRWLRGKRPPWFSPENYRRKVHPFGHVTYFRNLD